MRFAPELLAPFDRIVIATGAEYRLGLGRIPSLLLDAGIGRAPVLRRIFAMPAFRQWFYGSARKATGVKLKHLAREGQKVTVIGDAAVPGKSMPAIHSAFEAALLSR